MKLIFAGLRLTGFSLAIVFYFMTAMPLYIFLKPFPFGTRKILNRLLRFYSRIACLVLGIKPEFILEDKMIDGNHLIVSNHLSYIDVIAICSRFPGCFVTSVEIRDTPFLGHIAKLGGCLFVERRSRENLSEEIKEIRKALESGLNVCIFPEATSTDGSEVLRFKTPLFKAAVDSGSKVLPLTLNYKKIGKEELTVANRDKVCWYGDMSFFPHLWSFLNIGRIHLDITVKSALNSSNEDHTSLSLKAYERVSSGFIPLQIL